MKRILAILALVPLLAMGGQNINTGGHRKIFSSAASAPCGITTSLPVGDYWAGSYSASPITTNWTDQSSYGNSMAPSGSPTWSATAFGVGLAGVTLSGTSQYFSAVSAQFPASSFTNFAAYAIISMPSSGGGALFGSHNNNGIQWDVTQGSPGSMVLKIEGGSTLCSYTSPTFTANTSYEVAMVMSASSCAFYVNGSSVFINSYGTIGDVNGSDIILSATRSADGFKGSAYEEIFTHTSTYDSGIHTCWVGYGLP